MATLRAVIEVYRRNHKWEARVNGKDPLGGVTYSAAEVAEKCGRAVGEKIIAAICAAEEAGIEAAFARDDDAPSA